MNKNILFLGNSIIVIYSSKEQNEIDKIRLDKRSAGMNNCFLKPKNNKTIFLLLIPIELPVERTIFCDLLFPKVNKRKFDTTQSLSQKKIQFLNQITNAHLRT